MATEGWWKLQVDYPHTQSSLPSALLPSLSISCVRVPLFLSHAHTRFTPRPRYCDSVVCATRNYLPVTVECEQCVDSGDTVTICIKGRPQWQKFN